MKRQVDEPTILRVLEDYFIKGHTLQVLATKYKIHISTVRNFTRGYRRSDVYEKFIDQHPDLELPRPQALSSTLSEGEIQAIAERVVALLQAEE